MSAWEIIRDTFIDDHCRACMLWMATQTAVPPEQPMSGRLAWSLCHGRQRFSWCVPKGGSGALTDAPVRLIAAHGGMVLTGKSVQQLILEGGRCAGVECREGSRYHARKAVRSTVHVEHLVDMATRGAASHADHRPLSDWGDHASGPVDFGRTGTQCGGGHAPRLWNAGRERG
jgi:phytoene dehydrogenase-like protein